MTGRREYGDYQTPPDFAEKVCLYLRDRRRVQPSAVVEPTCGVGNFLSGSLALNAVEYYGIELNPAYCEICRNTIRDRRVSVINADIFSFATKPLIKDRSHVLVLGNPPWATNSALSAAGGRNLPAKTNFKGLRGMDALTGASNFDICEAIILRLIDEYRDSDTMIAMLCKLSVARNIFQELKRRGIPFASCDVLEFDASAVFGISASACVLLVQLSEQPLSPDVCNVYDLDRPTALKTRFGFSNGTFRGHLDRPADNFDGVCCFEWRQGVKHDCAKIMELTLRDGVLRNAAGELVDPEPEFVYPLVKSSMFKSPVICRFRKFVIVTQKKPREETDSLAWKAPKTWAYLNRNRRSFENRKSAIYRNAPSFSMFGVGEYSYARYKVGVSGFYKRPLFAVLYAEDGKPVMTDDTGYFIGFDRFDRAYVVMLLLNSERVQKFLADIAFPDAKRPYTKKLLQRIDFGKIAACVSFQELERTEQSLRLTPYATDAMYQEFRAFAAERTAREKIPLQFEGKGAMIAQQAE